MKEYMETESPAFSDFRRLMDAWDLGKTILECEERINDILDKHELILFFTKGDDVFGSPEEGRLVFAKLKTDTEDDPMQPGFRQEARFPAFNLFKCMGDGEAGVESVFGIKDLPDISVIDREKAVEMMRGHGK